MNRIRHLSLSIAISAALSAMACTVTTSSGAEISKSELEQQSMSALTAKTGQQASQITCPGGLKAEAGASIVCSMPLDGKTYDVTITVKSVDNGKAQFDVVVASAPRAS